MNPWLSTTIWIPAPASAGAAFLRGNDKQGNSFCYRLLVSTNQDIRTAKTIQAEIGNFRLNIKL